MAQIKTAELEGATLDWVVAKCEGYSLHTVEGARVICDRPQGKHGGLVEAKFSTDWAQGGPILEREQIGTKRYWNNPDQWTAEGFRSSAMGRTPLIAAMRCYVASKLGGAVELPDELLKGK